jgi:hypothetical protein
MKGDCPTVRSSTQNRNGSANRLILLLESERMPALNPQLAKKSSFF